MKAWQFFALLSAVYIAPSVSGGVAFTLGAFNLVVSVVAYATNRDA